MWQRLTGQIRLTEREKTCSDKTITAEILTLPDGRFYNDNNYKAKDVGASSYTFTLKRKFTNEYLAPEFIHYGKELTWEIGNYLEGKEIPSGLYELKLTVADDCGRLVTTTTDITVTSPLGCSKRLGDYNSNSILEESDRNELVNKPNDVCFDLDQDGDVDNITVDPTSLDRPGDLALIRVLVGWDFNGDGIIDGLDQIIMSNNKGKSCDD